MMTESSVPTIHVILTGSPVEGLSFYGPFNDGDTASRWAQTALTHEENSWWVGKLTKVNSENTGHVLVTGAPSEGFKFYGLFADPHAANLYGLTHFDRKGWWVCPLECPLRAR